MQQKRSMSKANSTYSLMPIDIRKSGSSPNTKSKCHEKMSWAPERCRGPISRSGHRARTWDRSACIPKVSAKFCRWATEKPVRRLELIGPSSRLAVTQPNNSERGPTHSTDFPREGNYKCVARLERFNLSRRPARSPGDKNKDGGRPSPFFA